MAAECEKCKKEDELTDGLCGQCGAEEDNLQTPSSQKRSATPCECGEDPVRVKSMMQCTSCTRWWHPACVGLNGLTKYATDTIIQWKCPVCFKFPSGILEKVQGEMEVIVSEGNTGIKEEVKRQIQDAIPAMVEVVVDSVKTALGESQVSDMMKEANEKITKSWADITRVEQKKVIHEVVEKTSETALTKSICLIDANLTEQKKRVRNAVISNINEDYGGRDTTLAEVVVDVLDEEEMTTNDIVMCKRLGLKKPGGVRPVLVVFKSEGDAQYFHNWGRGRKLRGKMWVNPDLTRTERDADYRKRQERKRRRSAEEEDEQDSSSSHEQSTDQDGAWEQRRHGSRRSNMYRSRRSHEQSTDHDGAWEQQSHGSQRSNMTRSRRSQSLSSAQQQSNHR